MQEQRIKTKLFLSISVVIVTVSIFLISVFVLFRPETVSAAYEPYATDTGIAVLPISTGGTQTRATDMFIKFDGVDGESTDESHRNWSDIESFSQGQFRETSGVGTRSGLLLFNDILISKALDKASPKLAEAVCKGTVFPKVEIHVTDSAGPSSSIPYYAYELTNARITSYSIGGSAQADEVPTEEFSLNFEEIKVVYTEKDAAGTSKGNVEYEWKVEEGEP